MLHGILLSPVHLFSRIPSSIASLHWQWSAWAFLALVFLLVTGGAAAAAGLLGGTVLDIDLETPQVVLQMPEGYASLFAVATAEVLKGVKVGDRISIELDEEGQIIKVVKLPVDPGN